MATREKHCTISEGSKGRMKNKRWEKLEVAVSEVRQWPEWKRVGFQTSSTSTIKAKVGK